MRTSASAIAIAFAAGASLASFGAGAFDSGSTGANGAYSPTVSDTLDVPASGIFNYTTVNIPAGVVVKFRRNATNTPIVILASGNVTIAGTLDVRGTPSPDVGASGGGAQGDDGTPGVGGPGGFDGGRGGQALAGQAQLVQLNAGAGLGPGGGGGGAAWLTASSSVVCDCRGCTSPNLSNSRPGAGAGFSLGADTVGTACVLGSINYPQSPGGATYGSTLLLPLIGGSGGGGGGGGSSFEGSGGGGGGGAILIASSGTVNVTGSILADGGASGASSGGGCGSSGGGGSGGAIRILATTIAGNGTISAQGGNAGVISTCSGVAAVQQGSPGAPGRVRLEADSITRTAASSPVASTSLPGTVFVAGTPTLRIASVAGVAAPASPTGNADVTLPASTPNPVTVVFETTGVPVGNTVQVTVTPAFGTRSTAITPALTGSTALATASTNVNLPVGPSVLSAQTTYTVVAGVGDLLKNFAGNERVEKVTLMATLGGPSKAKLITVSGREYEVPADVLRIAALGG